MGVQEDKIQKALDTYKKSVKVGETINPKKWLSIVKKHLNQEEFKKILTRKPPPFKHFDKTWTKKRIMDIPHWKGDTWDQVIEFCKLFQITPKEAMNWAAGKKINKTDEKTINIALLFYSSPSKLSVRSKAISLSKKIIEIDSSMKQRNNEDDKVWHERIYQRVFKAKQRFNL